MSVRDDSATLAALRAVERARKKRERADDELRTSILEARQRGASLAEVGKAAGVSRNRVWQIERGL